MSDIQFSKNTKRKKILSLFLENQKQFNAGIVFELIDLELKNKENKGQLITKDYLEGKLDRQSCLERLKEQGYSIWWSSEILWYIIRIELFTHTPHSPSLSVLSADCLLELVSGNYLAKNSKPKHQQAKITLLIDEELDVKEFSFEWIKT
jgi:hypothetical protein